MIDLLAPDLLAPVLLAAAAIALLSACALRERRKRDGQRSHLLDAAAGILDKSRLRAAPDGFPVLDGHLSDGRRLCIELIADTLVCRRLPQLWLKLTLAEYQPVKRPSIGALSRPTGAEFYSMVHDLPEWLMPPPADIPILLRGDGAATPAEVRRASAIFQALLRNAAVKEAVITPHGVRLIRQVAEGERGAHLLLRQVRFPIEQVPVDLIRTAIAEAQLLSGALAGGSTGTLQANAPEPVEACG